MKNVVAILFSFVVIASLKAADRTLTSIQGMEIDKDFHLQEALFNVSKKVSFKKYVSVNLAGIPFFSAQFKLGLRKEARGVGYDLGVTGCKSKATSYFGGYGSLLYLFNPDSRAKYYAAGGVEIAPYWSYYTHGIWGSPRFSLGRSRVSLAGTNDFFQLNVNGPYIFAYRVNSKQFDPRTSTRIGKYSFSLDYGLFF